MNKSIITHRIASIFQLIMLTVNSQYMIYKKSNNAIFVIRQTIHIFNNTGFEPDASLNSTGLDSISGHTVECWMNCSIKPIIRM